MSVVILIYMKSELPNTQERKVMDTYHKINALYKRHTDGRKKGKLIDGDWAIPEFEYLAKNKWEFTEKVDGTNIRICWGFDAGERAKSVKFGGRSDSAQIPNPLLAVLEETFTNEAFEATFPNAAPNDIILFGEGIGPKIQDGGKYSEDYIFVLFDVKVAMWWLDRANVDDVASKFGVRSVPVIGRGTLQDAIDIVSIGFGPNEHSTTKFWGGKNISGLKSAWGDFEAEGIVARPVVDLFDRKGQRIITKIKAVDFK